MIEEAHQQKIKIFVKVKEEIDFYQTQIVVTTVTGSISISPELDISSAPIKYVGTPFIGSDKQEREKKVWCSQTCKGL